MIRRRSFFLIFSLWLVVGFACKEPEETSPPPPVSGKGIKIEDSKQYGNVRISWDAVPGAARYNIEMKGTRSFAMKGFYTRLYHIVGLPKGAYTTSVSALDAGGTVLERTEEVSYTVVANNSYAAESTFPGENNRTFIAIEPYGGWASQSTMYVTVNDELPLGTFGYTFRLSNLTENLSDFTPVLDGFVDAYPFLLKGPIPHSSAFKVLAQLNSYRGTGVHSPTVIPAYYPFTVITGLSAITSAVQNLKATVNGSQKTVTFNWDNNDKNVWLYILEYKAPGGLVRRLSATAYDNTGIYSGPSFSNGEASIGVLHLFCLRGE